MLRVKNLRSQCASSDDEYYRLRSQNVTLKRGQHVKYLPYAFTEHGTIMLATILNSEIAINASIYIVRAFVKLREFLQLNKDLAKKIEEMESKYDKQFQVVFEAIKQLIKKDNNPRKELGYLKNK